MLNSPNNAVNKIITLVVNQHNIHDVQFIKEILDNHQGNPNINCADGTPLIAYAIHCEALETAKFLLEQKVNILALDSNGCPSIQRLAKTSDEFFNACFDWALEQSHWLIINLYLLQGISIAEAKKWEGSLQPLMQNDQNRLSSEDKFKAISLYCAIKKQHLNAVKCILNHVNPNVKCILGSPLKVAINALEYPANAKWTTKELYNYRANNPVMYEIIEILLKKNANPRAKIYVSKEPNEPFTPLTFSVYAHDIKLLELLLAYNPHLADAPLEEATKRYLLESDERHKTPLTRAVSVKSRKMYDCLLQKYPNLLMEDIYAFSDFFDHAGDYTKFLNEVLKPLSYAQRKKLFEAFMEKAGESVVNTVMRKNSVPLASVLLRYGADFPTIQDNNGQLQLGKIAKRKLSFPKWNALFKHYFEDLTAAEVTPSAVVLAANVIYDHTHQSEFATAELKGYLPNELFDLYRSTPQRRDFREAHYKPELRKCLEENLILAEAESTQEVKVKKAKMKA